MQTDRSKKRGKTSTVQLRISHLVLGRVDAAAVSCACTSESEALSYRRIWVSNS